MKFYNSTTRGFTLIELIVVIAIIGILASVVLASITVLKTKGNDARRLSETKEIQKSLERYYSENGNYPVTTWTCSYQNSWKTGSLGTSLKQFLPKMPVDPINESVNSYNGGLSYCYYSNGYGKNGGWYMLVYTLENKNTQLDERADVTACNGSSFNYGGNDGYIITTGGSCVSG